MSDPAQKTKGLLSQAEKNLIENRMIPKRPQKNSSFDAVTSSLGRKGKISQIKEILNAYTLNSRPQSKPKTRPASVQPKGRVTEGTQSSNITPRIDTNAMQKSHRYKQNMSNLIKNQKHIDPIMPDTKHKLPETPADKGNIKKIHNSSNRECPSIHTGKSPVDSTSSKHVVQKEILKGSFSVLRARELASHNESNNNSRVGTSRTPEPENNTMKLNSKTELVRKSLPIDHRNDDSEKDELRSRSSGTRKRIDRFRGVLSSAQPRVRDRSELLRSQQISDISTENARPTDGLTHDTSSYKKFVALMVNHHSVKYCLIIKSRMVWICQTSSETSKNC